MLIPSGSVVQNTHTSKAKSQEHTGGWWVQETSRRLEGGRNKEGRGLNQQVLYDVSLASTQDETGNSQMVLSRAIKQLPYALTG